MANFKTARGDGFFQSAFGLLANMRAKFALRDGVEKSAHFVVLSVNLKLDAAIGEVAHPASDIEAVRYVPNRPAKADTLNVAFIKYLERDHAVGPSLIPRKTRPS
jgi:hypothetical protein